MARHTAPVLGESDSHRLPLVGVGVGFLGLVLALASCGGSGGGDDAASVGEGETPAPTTRVTNALKSESLDWPAVVTMEIGGASAVGPAAFSKVAAFLVDENGYMYVVDDASEEIRVFDSEGGHVRSFGRRGKGPGEFLDAKGLNWGPSGLLWVWDPAGRRFSALTITGETVTTRIRTVYGSVYPWRGDFLPTGEMVDWGVRHFRSHPNAAPDSTAISAIRLGLEFDQQDTVFSIRYPRDVAPGGTSLLPFRRKVSVYLDRLGTAWVSTLGTYEISRIPFELGADRVFSLESEGAAVARSERDSVRLLIGSLPPPAAAGVNRLVGALPRHRPPIERIFGDNAEFVYVVPSVEGRALGEVLDVFDRDGRYRGRLELPVAIDPSVAPVATKQSIWAVAKDSLDAHRLVRIAVSRPE